MYSDESCVYNMTMQIDYSNVQCICQEGYNHDMFALRERACCYQNQQGVLSIIILLMIISSFGFIYSIYMGIKVAGIQQTQRHKPGSKNKSSNRKHKAAKRMLQQKGNVVVLMIFCFASLILFCFRHIVNKFVFDGTLMFIALIHLALSFGILYLSMFYHLLPLFKIVKIKVTLLIFRLRVMYVFFRVLQLLLTVLAMVLFGDFLNPSLDKGWNTLVMVFYMTIAIEVATLSGFFTLICKSILAPAAALTESSSSSSRFESNRTYLTRVYSISKIVTVLSPIIVLYFILIGIIYFSVGYFPYIFVAFLMFWICLPCFLIFGLYFTFREEREETISKSSIELSSGKESQAQIGLSAASRGMKSEMTSIQSVTNVETVSDPVLLSNDKKWRNRSNWIETEDANGLPCYYNTVTKEWSFDAPSTI